MFSQVTPILPADDHQGVAAGAILARLDALGLVIATLAKLTGDISRRPKPDLAGNADLAGAIAALPLHTARRMVTECDSIAAALTAGLLAVEKARQAGHMNLSAARLLYDEASAAIADLRVSLVYAGVHSASH